MKNQLNHIAFIMDGNGRWAIKRNLPRIEGHNEGVKRIGEIIEGCIKHKIKYISFFCFSTENWNRPKKEVNFLIKKISQELSDKNISWFIERNINVKMVGFKQNFPSLNYNNIKTFCDKTKNCNQYFVNFYFNYGARKEIISACSKMMKLKLKPTEQNFTKCLLSPNFPDVDLLIRTSGEERISNFLLWQIAYAEIIFEKTYWPDYTVKQLNKNISQYNKRNRRFGAISNGC